MHLGLFRNCMKLGAKWCELVQLMQKFVPRSHIRIFRNERTQSTPLDPKLKFWWVSYNFGAFCTSSAYFAPSFVRQPNGPKCTKIVRNAPKHEFRVQWGGSCALVAKNSDATSWHELLHQFGSFCTEFRNSTKRSPMPQNYTKCTKT